MSCSVAFPGILNWQRRVWLTINQFNKIRSDGSIRSVDPTEKLFLDNELRLQDARNLYICGTTFNYKHSHQLSVGVSKMQALTKAIRVSDSL